MFTRKNRISQLPQSDLTCLTKAEKQWLREVRKAQSALDKAFLKLLTEETEAILEGEFDENAERWNRAEKMRKILERNVSHNGNEYNYNEMEAFLKSVYDDGIACGVEGGYSIADMV